MKGYILITALFLLASCGKKQLYQSVDKNWLECRASSLTWRVVPIDAGMEMEKEYSSCDTCPVPNRFEFDVRSLADIKRRIEGLGFKVSGIQMVPAVYTEKNVERYTCRVCNGDMTDKKCMVENYETLLLKAEVPDSDEGFMYFDLVTICPPPRGCDRTTIVADSTNTDNGD
ncbi:MAG: hypothetical protein EON98_11885, partial [Chitinophagaceae bacterium]